MLHMQSMCLCLSLTGEPPPQDSAAHLDWIEHGCCLQQPDLILKSDPYSVPFRFIAISQSLLQLSYDFSTRTFVHQQLRTPANCVLKHVIRTIVNYLACQLLASSQLHLLGPTVTAPVHHRWSSLVVFQLSPASKNRADINPCSRCRFVALPLSFIRLFRHIFFLHRVNVCVLRSAWTRYGTPYLQDVRMRICLQFCRVCLPRSQVQSFAAFSDCVFSVLATCSTLIFNTSFALFAASGTTSLQTCVCCKVNYVPTRSFSDAIAGDTG